MNPTAIKLTALLGSASILTMAGLTAVHAQQVAQTQTAQATPAQAIPEQVIITGSLIRGAAAVGVPVTTLSDQDFKTTGALTTSDVLKNVPSAVIYPETSSTDPGANNEKPQGVNLRGLSTKGDRTLMLIDGMRFPSQGDSGCTVDPSIVPQLALSRVDVLADGASATYGSDAVAGVINLILKRGYSGAITEGSFGISPGYGHAYYRGSFLYGTTWSSGDVTVSYEHYNQDHTPGTARDYYTFNYFDAAGVDNRSPLINSVPGTVVIGRAKLPNSKLAGTGSLPGVPGSFSATAGSGCSNCYAIPAGQNGQSLTWAAIVANTPVAADGTTLGTGNEINPFTYAWELPDQERNAATITFDQTIIPNVQLFIDGIYNNRRALFYTVGGLSPGTHNALSIAVPSSNPYYPSGAPAGTLNVYYDLSSEVPSRISGTELSERYDGGFNITLPRNWLAKIYAAANQENDVNVSSGLVNANNVSAALGWTVPANAGLGSFTKPANVPYLNLFCDPTQYTCNDPATLSYISGFRDYSSRTIINEIGLNADGPVYMLPGGEMKAAVGALYDHTAFFMNDVENYNAQALSVIQNAEEYDRRQVWAVFGQLDIPIVGDNNKLPLVDSLNVEASVRYDHYNLYGGTTNPKVSATWGIIDGLQLQGAWGTSFRAPSFQEAGAILGALDQPINTAAGGSRDNVPTCASTTETPPAGTAAAYLGCANQYLGGIRLGNGAGIAEPVRHGYNLKPETAQNVSAGIEWAPTDSIFKGLDIQATYFYVRIRNMLQGCPVGTSTGELLDNPVYQSCFVTRQTDPTFDADVAALLSFSKSQLPTNIVPSDISFVMDGAIRNIGWQALNGIDFNASYVWDMGNLGAWNAGVTGTYQIDSRSQYFAGDPAISEYSTPDSGTTNSGGRMRYRARLGWDGGPANAWSVVGFMNFWPHYNINGGPLPPLCFLQGEPSCASFGPQYAQYTQQYPTLSNLVPGMYTFDMSFSYNTGDVPANKYLKNINVVLTVNNIFNRRPPYQYSIATASNTPHAFYTPPNRGGAGFGGIGADQRYLVLTLTKTW
jgi:iron complex outermembrane recepter protein